jgi:cell division protein FtsQ
LERLKAIPRNATAAAEADSYRPELLADDEPRYLRRQKPVEIRRKKFSGRGWPFYRRLLVFSFAGVASMTAAVYGTRFLLYSPVMRLNPDQIEVNGNRIVSRKAVLQQFTEDRGRSVLRVPLDDRRVQLAKIHWVESATVQRILPNRIRVEVIERTPIAFARIGNSLSVVDVHGVILDRPPGEDLHFPVVSGISEDLPPERCEERMQIYQEFMKDIDLVRSGSSEHVSEVDLANPKDLRVVMTGLASANDAQVVSIHFGAGEFTGKYKMLIDNFSQWQANAGRVQSIDLQYSRQVVVNPDTSSGTSSARTK